MCALSAVKPTLASSATGWLLWSCRDNLHCRAWRPGHHDSIPPLPAQAHCHPSPTAGHATQTGVCMRGTAEDTLHSTDQAHPDWEVGLPGLDPAKRGEEGEVWSLLLPRRPWSDPDPMTAGRQAGEDGRELEGR